MKKNVISFDEMFMGVAELVAMRSKDPSQQVGACIVKDGRIISTGYNGMPNTVKGIDNDQIYPWNKGNDDISLNKYPYVVHAELNAILNSTQLVQGSDLYVTLFPCNECAKAIVQSGIKRLVYIEQPEREYNKISEKILCAAGVEVYRYNSKNRVLFGESFDIEKIC